MVTAAPGLFRTFIDASAFTTDTTLVAAATGRQIFVHSYVLCSPGGGGKITLWDGASSGTLKLATLGFGSAGTAAPIVVTSPQTDEADPYWFATSSGNALVATQAVSIALYGHIIYTLR